MRERVRAKEAARQEPEGRGGGAGGGEAGGGDGGAHPAAVHKDDSERVEEAIHAQPLASDSENAAGRAGGERRLRRHALGEEAEVAEEGDDVPSDTEAMTRASQE